MADTVSAIVSCEWLKGQLDAGTKGIKVVYGMWYGVAVVVARPQRLAEGRVQGCRDMVFCRCRLYRNVIMI